MLACLAWGGCGSKMQAGRQAGRQTGRLCCPAEKKGRHDSQPKPKAKSLRSAAGPALQSSQMGALAKTQEGEDKDEAINGLAVRRRISARRPVALLRCCLMFFCLRLGLAVLVAWCLLGARIGGVWRWGEWNRGGPRVWKLGSVGGSTDASGRSIPGWGPEPGAGSVCSNRRLPALLTKGRQRENGDVQGKEKKKHIPEERPTARGKCG